jgi:hypothetical protein
MKRSTNLLKRFLVFSGEDFYPGGGWKDFVGSVDNIYDAMSLIIGAKGDWSEIVDSTTQEVVLPINYPFVEDS